MTINTIQKLLSLSKFFSSQASTKENILHTLTLHQDVGNVVILFILGFFFPLSDAIYESHFNFALTAETMLSSETQAKS